MLRKQTIIMTSLVVISGAIVSFTFELHNGSGDVVKLLQETSVGLIFGIIFTAYLYRAGLVGSLRAVGLVVTSTASWMIALKFAVGVYQFLDANLKWSKVWDFTGAGVCAGLLGAALLVLSIMVVTGYFKNWRLCLATVVCGGAAGGLLGATDLFDSGLVLFTVWQGAFAFCLSLALPKQAN